MSHFIIDDSEYEFEPDPFAEFHSKRMGVELNKVLEPGMIFDYEYDYGSTTQLVLEVISVRRGKLKRGEGSIMLVARNDPMSFACRSCKKEEATNICTNCVSRYSFVGLTLCKSCVKRHKCGAQMALPIVNSPRTGVCGYTG